MDPDTTAQRRVQPPISGSQDKGSATRHRRAHNACLPCRTRKCKCELGDVDAPREPPCGKCRREGRECVFVETRRGQRPSSAAARSARQTTEPADPLPAPQHPTAPPPRSDDQQPISGRSRAPVGRLVQPLPKSHEDSSDFVHREHGNGMFEPDADITFDFFSEPLATDSTHERPAATMAMVPVPGGGDTDLAVIEDDSDKAFQLVEQGVLDWDHLQVLYDEYLERRHLWLPLSTTRGIPSTQDALRRFAQTDPMLLMAIVITGSRTKGARSAFYRRVNREASSMLQTKIDGILRGDHEPTLDLIAAILLLVDNEPFSPVKEATTSHDSQLRQRWMLLGYAIRCACRLGLHEPRLLASEPDTYRDRAALLWSYCFMSETHLNMFVPSPISTRGTFPTLRSAFQQTGPGAAPNTFRSLSPVGDSPYLAQVIFDYSQFLSSVNESLYGVPNKLERMIETGEYHVTMDSLDVSLQSLKAAWSRKRFQDEKSQLFVKVLHHLATVYMYSAELALVSTPPILHQTRGTAQGKRTSQVNKSHPDFRRRCGLAATAASSVLSAVISLHDHENYALPLRLDDYAELACVVLVQAMHSGWRPMGDVNANSTNMLIEKTCALLECGAGTSSHQTCGQAILAWRGTPAPLPMFQFSDEAYGDLLIRVSPESPLVDPPAGQQQRPARGHGPTSKPWPGQAHREDIVLASPAESNEGEHDAALALEDMAMSRGQNVERITREKDLGAFGSTLHVPGSEHPTQQQTHADFVSLDVLPNASVGRFVIQYYIDNVNWFIPCIHVPSFEADCSAWWSRPAGQPLDQNELQFLPLYCACLVVGLHLLNPTGMSQLHHTDQERDRLCQDLWRLGYAMLQQSDWMQVHSIRSIQTIIVIGPYLNSVKRSEFHWTLLGSAIKVAQNLRLARLGPEPNEGSGRETIRKLYGARWIKAADREVARRVWWQLVELDWTFAAEHEFNATIYGDFVTCLPANVSDSELTGDGPVVSKPMTQRTSMSYFLNRLQLFMPLKDLLETSYRPGRFVYAAVMETHQGIMRNIAAASPFYDRDANLADFVSDAKEMRQCAIERCEFHRSADLQLVRLHRFHATLAARLPRYDFSRQICVKAAKSLLIPELEPFDLPSNYWLMSYRAFTACVVLLREGTHATPDQSTTLLDLVESGIERLYVLSQQSTIQASADYLKRLLSAARAEREESTLTPSSAAKGKKRDRSSEDALTLSGLIKKVRTGSDSSTLLDNATAEFFNISLPPELPSQSETEYMGPHIVNQMVSGMLDPNLFDLVHLMWGDEVNQDFDFSPADMECSALPGASSYGL